MKRLSAVKHPVDVSVVFSLLFFLFGASGSAHSTARIGENKKATLQDAPGPTISAVDDLEVLPIKGKIPSSVKYVFRSLFPSEETTSWLVPGAR